MEQWSYKILFIFDFLETVRIIQVVTFDTLILLRLS